MTASADRGLALTCFVSAASQTDTSAVLEALRIAGVRVRTIEDIPLGEDVSIAISNAVLSADFVCVVVENDALSATVAFEAGVAAGSRRPIVIAVSGPTSSIDVGPLASMPRINYAGDDSGQIQLNDTFRAYVSNVQPIAAQLQIDWDRWLGPNSVQRGLLQSRIAGSGLERYVAERLAKAGGVVNTEASDVDALATFPLLGAIHQVAFTVKTRRSNKNLLLRQDRERLRSSMIRAGIQLGVIVYSDTDVERHIDIEDESLLSEYFGAILSVSTSEFSIWSDAELIEQLTQLRNAVLHGQR